MSLKIEKIETGVWKENCYLVYNEKNEAFIIDPGSDGNEIIQFIDQQNLSLKFVLLTHGHYDHIGAVQIIKDKYQIPCYMNFKDLKLLKHANMYRVLFMGLENITIPSIDFDLENHEDIIFSDLKIIIFKTPGHTEGSVCFLLGKHLFTGDTLLPGTIGRMDLPGANKVKYVDSLLLLSNLPVDLEVFPGHGKITSIGNELSNNKEFQKYVNERQD